MKNAQRFITVILLLMLLFGNPLSGQTIPKEGLDSITSKEMKDHVYYLASDAMRGRDTQSPELDSCAVYISRAFAEYGLKSASPEQAYYQSFNMLKARLSDPNTLSLHAENDTEYELKTDFVPLHTTANGKVSAPVVFAGYGISASEYGYDDYASVDVKGKIVLIFTNEPQERDSTSVFEGQDSQQGTKRDRSWRCRSAFCHEPDQTIPSPPQSLAQFDEACHRKCHPPDPGEQRGKTYRKRTYRENARV